jgi:5'-nucleotidase
MRILVTNDDGLEAEGLQALAEVLSRKHDVLVIAPDRERSGVSHALTLGAAQKLRKIGEKAYTSSGTPADCVILAMLGAVDFAPEIVVSGINRGPNLGTDIVYSGTCAAAREAALGGIPGIAVSCASRDERLRYGAAALFVLNNLEALAAACSGRAFVNVNAPSADTDSQGAEWTHPCARVYGNELKSFAGPDGYDYCFIAGEDSGARADPASDYSVVSSGKVSVSQILVQPQVPSGFLSGREFR